MKVNYRVAAGEVEIADITVVVTRFSSLPSTAVTSLITFAQLS